MLMDALQSVPEPVQTGGAVALVLVVARVVESGIKWRHGELRQSARMLETLEQLNGNVSALIARIDAFIAEHRK